MIAEDTLHVFGVLSNRDNPALRSWHDAGNIPMETEEVDDEVPNLSEIACLDEPLRHEEVKESSASGSDIVDKSDEPLLERRNLVEVISNVEIENDVLSAVSAGSLQSSPVFVEFHEASKLSLPEEALGKLPTKQLHYSSSSPNLNFPSDDCSLKSETLEIKKVTLAEFADVPKSDEEALFIKGIPDLKTEIDELKVEMEEPQRSSPVLDCLEEGNCVPEEASKTRQVMDSVRSSSPGSNPMPDGSLLESESLHIKDMTSSGSDVNKTLSGNGGIPSVELDIYELSADSADARKSSLSQGAFDLPPVKDLVRSSSFTISNSTSDGCALKKFSSDEHLPAAKKFDFGNDGEILERVNLQSLACQISECELMLRSLEPSINDADARARVDRWKRAVYDGKFRCTRLLLQLFLGKDLESKKRSPRLIAPTPLKRTFDSIRPFHVLCQWGILPGIEILYDVAERYSIPTQCSKFHKLDSFFRTHVMSEFCLNLDIGMLKCLSTVPSVSDGKLDIDVFDPECVAFIEAWATSLQCRQVSKFNRRTLTHDIFASEGFFHLAPDPRWEMLQSDQDSEVFAEIDKYYVDSGPSSVSSEPPPVSQILCREEKLDNIVAEHVSRAMENLNLGDAGWNLGTFFHLFAGVAYHILYSLLSGRPVVIAGIESSESNVVERVVCCTNLQKLAKVGLLMFGWCSDNGSTLTATLMANQNWILWRSQTANQLANFLGSLLLSSTVSVGSSRAAKSDSSGRILADAVDRAQVLEPENCVTRCLLCGLPTRLVDFLVGAGLRPMAIPSYNHWSNNDDQNLSEAAQFCAKELCETNVVDGQSLMGSDHLVVIKYVPAIGDSKQVLDESETDFFQGGRRTFSMNKMCARTLCQPPPLILDLAEFLTQVKTAKDNIFRSMNVVLSLLKENK
ncbi:unnamed protein product [Notodromas monacha]|uniref:inositol-3-phosphate synthase n=1 Tax=Notodromas monacha TaxID=399045 RepID=A0A7R9BU92_9CRUS|nr:unnamed protein product [Notodromas monacha]CAG0920302.1 unnamed protein product [Notodromas monacha]